MIILDHLRKQERKSAQVNLKNYTTVTITVASHYTTKGPVSKSFLTVKRGVAHFEADPE